MLSCTSTGVLRDVHDRLRRVRAHAAHLGVEALAADEQQRLAGALLEDAGALLTCLDAGCDGLGPAARHALRLALERFRASPDRASARALAPAARAAVQQLCDRPSRVEILGLLGRRRLSRSATAPPRVVAMRPLSLAEAQQALVDVAQLTRCLLASGVLRRQRGPDPPGAQPWRDAVGSKQLG